MTWKLHYVFLAIGVFALGQNAEKARESLLNYSITGSSSSSSPSDTATYAMQHGEVQQLLLDLAASPRDQQYVEAALRGSGISLADMLSNGALRLEGGLYWLNFALLTRVDQETIVRVAGLYSKRLADAVLARRPEIEAQLRSYDLEGVDRRAVAFIVLGCFSLDWDGLRFATRHGYRAAPPKRKGGQFFFMAEERGGPSLKQIYWGSNSNVYGKYGFTTFGDHFSPRMGLSTIRRNGPPDLRSISPDSLAVQTGAMMLALRERPRSAAELSKAAGMPRQAVDSLLPGLLGVGYVRKDGERYCAAIPVLAKRDNTMVVALRRIGRQATSEWFTSNYEEFRTAVRDISPLRNHVPFSVAFDQLWHYLFGIANQKLVEAGVFVDPYSPETSHRGFVPVVYEHGVEVWNEK